MRLKKDITKFNELIKNQMDFGAEKYKLEGSSTREATDELFEFHGKNWLFGTMDKYCKRIANLEREKDLLKISCYCFILWLKRGYFVRIEGLKDVLDTTIEIKDKQFPLFLERVNLLLDTWFKNKVLEDLQNRNDVSRLGVISNTLKRFSKSEWVDISEEEIIGVYLTCFLIWFPKYFHLSEHDQDLRQVNDKK